MYGILRKGGRKFELFLIFLDFSKIAHFCQVHLVAFLFSLRLHSFFAPEMDDLRYHSDHAGSMKKK